MKEERFEKVVEWDINYEVIGMYICVIFGLILGTANKSWWFVLAMTVGYLFLTFILSLIKRKVYWRKI